MFDMHLTSVTLGKDGYVLPTGRESREKAGAKLATLPPLNRDTLSGFIGWWAQKSTLVWIAPSD